MSGYVISKSGSNSHKLASSIRFYDTKSAVQPKLFSTNFHVKNETLHLMLKNTSTYSLNVQATFRPTSGNGQAVVLPPALLNAGETSELDLQELRAASNSRDDLESVSVNLASDGLPGTLIGSLNSKNENNGVAYDIPLRDSGPKRISTGSYPWRLDDDYKSVVTITNVGSDLSRLGAELRYSGGRYVFTPQTLSIGETAKFNLKKIRDEAIPDSDGNILPANATVGQFKWSILGMASDTSRLIGRSEVISKSGRVSSSYSCNNNCPDSGPEYQVDSNPISLFSADYSNNNVREYWHHEYGGSWSFASVMPNLHTGDTNIAESEMIPSSTAMRTDGYDSGSTYWYSGEYTYYYYYDGGSDCYMTPWYLWETYGLIEVEPRVQKIQYKTPGTSSYVDVTGTLYVLKGTTVEFKAIPDTGAFPSGKPVWSGSSGATGSGQTKSVTFDTVSSSTSNFKTVVATARNLSVTVNVIVYDLEKQVTPTDNFTDRSQTTFGLREVLELNHSITPSGITATTVGGLRWAITTGEDTGSFISVNDEGTAEFRAPSSPASTSLKLSVLNGPSKDRNITHSLTTVAPTASARMILVTTGTGSPKLRHTQNVVGAGFKAYIHFDPKNVSFKNIQFNEGACEAETAGYMNGTGVAHSAGSTQLILLCNNTTGCRVQNEDMVYLGHPTSPTPYSSGTFLWKIPWYYQADGDPVSYYTAHQLLTTDNTGKATIEKGGISISFNVGDPTVNW